MLRGDTETARDPARPALRRQQAGCIGSRSWVGWLSCWLACLATLLAHPASPRLAQEACRQAAAAGVPVWFEPVSVPKSVRATGLLSLLSYVSPNERELAAMAAAARQQRGPAGGDWQQLSAAAHAPSPAAAAADPAEAAVRSMLPDIATLLLAGVQHVVLTLGADGAALCTLAAGRRAVTGVFGRTALAACCCHDYALVRLALQLASIRLPNTLRASLSPPCSRSPARAARYGRQLQRRRRLPGGGLLVWAGTGPGSRDCSGARGGSCTRSSAEQQQCAGGDGCRGSAARRSSSPGAAASDRAAIAELLSHVPRIV